MKLFTILSAKGECKAVSQVDRYKNRAVDIDFIRLQVVGDLLIHTDMSLNEIAHATEFEYDTYFIKQFTAKRDVTDLIPEHFP